VAENASGRRHQSYLSAKYVKYFGIITIAEGTNSKIPWIFESKLLFGRCWNRLSLQEEVDGKG